MKLIVVILLSLIALNSATKEDTSRSFDTCDYYGLNDGQFYTFKALGNNGWLNSTDSTGKLWFFQVCSYGGSDDVVDPCGVGSSVCIVGDETKNMGSSSTAKFSDTPYTETDGFEVMYGNVDDDSVKTVIDIVCSYEAFDPIITIESDGSFTTITVNTTYGCHQDMVDYTDEMYDYDSGVVINVGGFFFFVLMVVVGLVCSLCCCCCLMRRRRCQRNKDIAMKQFSNVAFQPIPSGRGVQQMAPQQPIPAYNPYLVQQQSTQPQFVYYYPSQPTNQPPVVPLQVNSTNDDEKLAKQLQAQFDREQV